MGDMFVIGIAKVVPVLDASRGDHDRPWEGRVHLGAKPCTVHSADRASTANIEFGKNVVEFCRGASDPQRA